MSGALLILNYDVVDEGALMDYRRAAGDVILGSRGLLVTSTARTLRLPESPPVGTHTVVIAYPSVADARRRYDSSEYQALLPDRLRVTEPVMAVVVEVTGELIVGA